VSEAGNDQPKTTNILRVGLRHTYELVRVHPVPFVLAIVGAALFAGATVAATEVLGIVVDRVVRPAYNPEAGGGLHIGLAAGAVVLVAVIRSAGVWARRYCAGYTTELARRRLRLLLAERYLKQPMGWYSDQPTGRLLAHVDSDTMVATEAINPLPYSVGVAFLGIFGAGALVATDWVMAVLAIGMFPVLVGINRWLSSVIERPAAEVQEAVGRVSSIAHESFDGSLIVKVLGLAQAEEERFGEANDDLCRKRVRFGYRLATYDVLNDTVPQLGTLAVVVVGAFRVSQGAITAGDVVQVATLFALLVAPMQVLGYFLSALAPAVAARRRIDGALGGAAAISARGASAVMPPVSDALPAHGTKAGMLAEPSVKSRGTAALVAQNLSYRYGHTDSDTDTLRGIDLTVNAGEMVALVGSTGSGKSTLMLLLAGLYPPATGTVELAGNTISGLSEIELADRRALVFQESFLFADTLRRNLDPYNRYSDESVWAALRMAAADFVAELPQQLETVVGERGVTLSGGQRQRVALARALLREPQLLLLDDATSAVDSVVEQRILRRVREQNRATTVIVAQRLSTIRLADRVAYLVDGVIEATGSHDELMRIDTYRTLAQAYEEQSDDLAAYEEQSDEQEAASDR